MRYVFDARANVDDESDSNRRPIFKHGPLGPCFDARRVGARRLVLFAASKEPAIDRSTLRWMDSNADDDESNRRDEARMTDDDALWCFVLLAPRSCFGQTIIYGTAPR